MAGLEIGRRYAKPANYKPATSFRELQLDERLVEALAAAKLDTPTEIQVRLCLCGWVCRCEVCRSACTGICPSSRQQE